jgi:hypothetical protein
MSDTRTPQEIAYDATRLSRTDYTPLSPVWEAILDITDDVTNDGRDKDAEREDTAAIIEILDAIDGGEQAVTVESGAYEESTWTEYRTSTVVLTKHDSGGVPPGVSPYILDIYEHEIDQQWTLAMLQQLHADLGEMLNDARVVAAFDCAGCAEAPASAAFCDQCGRKLS